MAKRIFDMLFAIALLILALPILAVAGLVICASDGHAPLYRPFRVGRRGNQFRMVKLRTMVPAADRIGASSTTANDARLTRFGIALRRYKLDELPQFWNVIVGDMSIVGPRPNLQRGGVDRYTAAERKLLSVRPGITDLASIVFSDEGEILKGSPDPDSVYDSLIRPWKSRLALLYVEHRSMALDLRLIGLTILALISKPRALNGVDSILSQFNASAQLRQVCARSAPLPAALPPGEIA